MMMILKLFVEIENCCEICTKYKQPGLKPLVGFSLSKDFKDTVSVDLKDLVVQSFYISLTMQLVLAQQL